MGGMDMGVKGRLWGSGSHTNTVVALLHWKGVRCFTQKKLGEMEYLVL